MTEPGMIHSDTADDTCPIRWSRATLRAMRQAMRRTTAFLDRNF